MTKLVNKICTKCQIEKDLLFFPARKKAGDKRASWCRECYKEYWNRCYYEKHQHYRSRHNTSRNKMREQNARMVFEYLTQNPCLRCGESDPIVLEFDHRDLTDKIGSISNLIKDSSWERVKSEIEKCDVLCANCHRRKSAAQFDYKRHFYI